MIHDGLALPGSNLASNLAIAQVEAITQVGEQSSASLPQSKSTKISLVSNPATNVAIVKLEAVTQVCKQHDSSLTQSISTTTSLTKTTIPDTSSSGRYRIMGDLTLPDPAYTKLSKEHKELARDLRLSLDELNDRDMSGMYHAEGS